MTPSESPVRIVLVSGSTRAGSTNTAALRTAAALDVAGVVATPWERLVDVPAFVPGDDGPPRPPSRSCAPCWPRRTPSCSARRSTPARCRGV